MTVPVFLEQYDVFAELDKWKSDATKTPHACQRAWELRTYTTSNVIICCLRWSSDIYSKVFHLAQSARTPQEAVWLSLSKFREVTGEDR